MGWIQELHIWSTKTILSSLLKTHGTSLIDKVLSTLMTEVDSVLNPRPLTLEMLNDGKILNQIFPSNLLTMKSKLVNKQEILICQKVNFTIKTLANDTFSGYLFRQSWCFSKCQMLDCYSNQSLRSW